MLFFSSKEDGADSAYHSTVNFSRIDSVTMLIRTRPPRTTTPVDEVVRYYARAVHPLRIADGRCAKVFAGSRRQDMFPGLSGVLPIEVLDG